MRIDLSDYPNAKKIYSVDFEKPNGGLNLFDLKYRLAKNQSPDILNLWWQDGILQCRDGQEYITDTTATSLGAGYASYSGLFYGHAFFHIGAKIYYCDPTATVPITLTELTLPADITLQENKGTFFQYQNVLYYKNRGAFIQITYANQSFTGDSVLNHVYTPTILLNASPLNGSGTMYQPENRINALKTVKYDAAETSGTATATGDGSTKTFSLGKTASADRLTGVDTVYVANVLISSTLYTVNISAGTVTFATAPESGKAITMNYKLGVADYKLPVVVTSVAQVKVNGVTKTQGTDYTLNAAKDTVQFVVHPPVSNPFESNTVEITYSLENATAKSDIMSCTYATVSGDNNVCILLGGCENQPNAVFWNSNDSVSMNPSYWPAPYYNLIGGTEDPVTGFGRQYSTTIVLKERSIGKLTYGIETISDRDTISFVYETINTKTGCDLPWSIQLIENNLVFCNTYQGVHRMRSSSAAYENNIDCISHHVNGDKSKKGLLCDLAESTLNKDSVISFDDNYRYWVCVGGHAYVWDYTISEYDNPSWFYFNNINPVSFFTDSADRMYHLNAVGNLTRFARNFSDYGGVIHKKYTTPTQDFGGYSVLKDVPYIILAIRSDTVSEVSFSYETDYGTWDDLTPYIYASEDNNFRNLDKRNLAFRNLLTSTFPSIFKRRPGLRHIRHFAVSLSNDQNGQDLSIVSLSVFYNFQGRER